MNFFYQEQLSVLRVLEKCKSAVEKHKSTKSLCKKGIKKVPNEVLKEVVEEVVNVTDNQDEHGSDSATSGLKIRNKSISR